MEIDLNNHEFQQALKLISDTDQSFFMTGKPGTGKSTFVQYFVKNVDKNFVVVAPTGIAAINVKGQTINSFFYFPFSPLLPDDDAILRLKPYLEKHKIVNEMDVLVIDEVSMVRADIIDAIDCYLRKNTYCPTLPFGGKQVLFVGDVFQLAPVVIQGSSEERILNELYPIRSYFYYANVFKDYPLYTIELKKMYRQSDPIFIEVLNKVRLNVIMQKDLQILNSRVISDEELKKKEFALTLTTTNNMAKEVNDERLSKLRTKEHKYRAIITGQYRPNSYPTDLELSIRKGAQVIFIQNDKINRWVNGSIGKIQNITDDHISVKLETGGTFEVNKVIWENNKYIYNRELRRIEVDVIGTFEHYPIKLAWATTIHKAQSLTLENVVIDFGRGAFTGGQAYVALSRVTSLEGLFLKRAITLSDIFVDPDIKNFAKTFDNPESYNNLLKRDREFNEKYS